jgi:tRNA pseudouridine38-40 synthase
MTVATVSPPPRTTSVDVAAPRHVYALTLEYDGTDFSGWQRQRGRRTVEGALLDALAAVTGEAAPLTAAGRTDAGAHAHAQVVGCTLRRSWPCDRLRSALNALLPADVVVVDVREAPPGFHARFDAIARTYRYVVAPRRERPAVLRQHAWYVRGDLDVDAMREAAAQIVGTHDLAAFGRSPRAGGSTVRTVHDVAVRRMRAPRAVAVEAEAPVGALASGDAADAEASVVVIDVTADAFLYGMMRNLAAALVAVGTGAMTRADVSAMIEHGRRERPLTTAPARGLHQWRVRYAAASHSNEKPG